MLSQPSQPRLPSNKNDIAAEQGVSSQYPNYLSIDPTSPSSVVLHHASSGYKVPPFLAFLLFFSLLLLLVFTGYISKSLSTDGNKGCLGPPFLYISYHESRNLLKYTRDGCSVSKDVLWYGGASAAASSLRDIVLRPYGNVKDALYVANAGENPRESPKVLVFGGCSQWNGMRSFIRTVINAESSPGAQHTYSLAFDDQSNLYVSFQHTDVVLRFRNTTYEPLPNPPNMTYFNDVHADGVFSNLNNIDTAVSDRNHRPPLHALHKSRFPTPSPAPTGLFESSSPTFAGSVDSAAPSTWFPTPTSTPAESGGSVTEPTFMPTFMPNQDGGSSPMPAPMSVPVPAPFSAPPWTQAPSQQQKKKYRSIQPTVPGAGDPTATNKKPDMSKFHYYEGTFVQFGTPGLHNITAQGVRSVRWVRSQQQLWIANEDLHFVLVVDAKGRYVDKIKVKNPIGLHVDEDRHNMVFVGSKKTSKASGAVYGIDIASRYIRKTYTLLGGILNHPTGIVSHEDTLFVAEQAMNVILTFNITTERYLKQIISLSPLYSLEQLALSPC